MRPRVSDTSLETLLRAGDPMTKGPAVSEAERAAFLARLSELPVAAPALPHRRPVGMALVFAGGVMFSLAAGLGIVSRQPKPKPLIVASVRLPSVPTPSPSVPTPSPSVPTRSPSLPKLSQNVLALSRRVPMRSPSLPMLSGTPPTPSPSVPEPVVTHILISADSTCAPEKTAPPTERITIRGDATSVVAVTESLSTTTNEETKEVSL